MSHPAIARDVGRFIGEDSFYMEILSAGGSTSPTDLIAGLMAPAGELSGDRFRSAASELNTFLTPIEEAGSAELSTGLDVGYDAVLFHGLTVSPFGETFNYPHC